MVLLSVYKSIKWYDLKFTEQFSLQLSSKYAIMYFKQLICLISFFSGTFCILKEIGTYGDRISYETHELNLSNNFVFRIYEWKL